MDAAALDHRHRTYDGWIPPTVATLLHEHGHHGVLREAAARGDWFCARRLGEAATSEYGLDGQATALALMQPFAATGWWPAVSTVAGLLTDWERVDEAIALLRPLADTGHRYALRDLARLLARQGHLDQIVALLGPRAADLLLAEELVELAAGHGRDKGVVGPPRIDQDAAEQMDDPVRVAAGRLHDRATDSTGAKVLRREHMRG
ncbi:hypothetical protein ACSHXN_01550 [Streptomyces sp. HUAS TT11]|uniref:hypothetical protein n=1 Tax=Streptomyces sp. HUAS TT11 TaxID=3447508 RepID=UPI003F659EBA